MGRVKELWQEQVDNVLNAFAAGKITRVSALFQLRQLGIDNDDAEQAIDTVNDGVLRDQGLL